MAKLVLTRMTTSLLFVSTSVSTDPSTDPSIPYPIHGPNTYGMGLPELITQAPRYTAYLRMFQVFQHLQYKPKFETKQQRDY